MDAYIIVGKASVGKSSLVRALTGIRNADKRLMAKPSAPNFTLWAKDSSLQEARINPQSFIAEVTFQNVDAALCTLWPRSCRSKGIVYPDAARYIRVFQTAGWNIQPVILLDNGSSTFSVSFPGTVLSSRFSNVRTNPFNSFAALIRAHWGWI
jgi:GTPase SAR1 family protein